MSHEPETNFTELVAADISTTRDRSKIWVADSNPAVSNWSISVFFIYRADHRSIITIVSSASPQPPIQPSTLNIRYLVKYWAAKDLVSIFGFSVIELCEWYPVAEVVSASSRTFFFDRSFSAIWARHCRFPCFIPFREQVWKRGHGTVFAHFKFSLSKLRSHFQSN